MTNRADSSPQDSAELLRQVDAIQSDTRKVLRTFWFPLALFGALTLISAPVQRLWSGAAVAAYWAVAGPVGGVVVGWYYRNRALRIGVTGPMVPYVITAVALLVGTFVLPALTRGDLQEVASVFAVAAGYLMFAWLDRSPTLAGLAVFIAAVPVVVLLAGVGHPGAVTAVVVGVPMVAVALASRPSSA